MRKQWKTQETRYKKQETNKFQYPISKIQNSRTCSFESFPYLSSRTVSLRCGILSYYYSKIPALQPQAGMTNMGMVNCVSPNLIFIHNFFKTCGLLHVRSSLFFGHSVSIFNLFFYYLVDNHILSL